MAVTESAEIVPEALSVPVSSSRVVATKQTRGTDRKFSLEVGEESEVEVAWSEEDSEVFYSLTSKQSKFVREYLLDFNATKATQRAGYAAKTENDAARIGYGLLRHPKVGPLLRKATQQTADEMGITRGWLLEKVRKLAESAEKDGNKTEASRAYALLAKLRGDMIERKEIDMRVVELKVNGVDVGDLR